MNKEELMIRNAVLVALAKQSVRFVPVGISARHVHLSQADLEKLFGAGYQLTPLKELSQPGQYASKEQVTVVGPKGELGKVRVLGPVRSATQVELAVTDAMKLGIKAPVRMSGELNGTPGCKLVGPAGEVTIDQGVIAAARHIHMSDEQAAAYGVSNGDRVSLRVASERPCIWGNVIVRCGKGHDLELHVDTDEANCALISNGEYVEIVSNNETGFGGSAAPAPAPAALPDVAAAAAAAVAAIPLPTPSAPSAPVYNAPVLDLVTEQDVNDAIRANRVELLCTARAIITPAAQDRSAATGLTIKRV